MLKIVFVVIVANAVIALKFNRNDDFGGRCGKDEEFNECPEAQCSPLTCFDVGAYASGIPERVECFASEDECNPQCVCRDGKVRDDKGDCVPLEECPECGGDPNAVAIDCGRSCPDDDGPCTTVCVPNTCACREGFGYDEDSSRCLPAPSPLITEFVV